jgi:hypothetical protein
LELPTATPATNKTGPDFACRYWFAHDKPGKNPSTAGPVVAAIGALRSGDFVELKFS